MSDKKSQKNNPVAKHAWKYNRSTVEEDRTKYNRKRKHKHEGY